MKRSIILVLLTLCIALTAGAQTSPRQKMIHMAALRIAESIQVPASDKEAFVTLYQNYKKESTAIMAVKAPQTGEPDQDAEAKILGDFAKSEKLLELRKKYYGEFRKILSPTQIQKMYDAERKSAVAH